MIRMQSLKDAACSAEGCFLIFRTFLGKRKESKKSAEEEGKRSNYQ